MTVHQVVSVLHSPVLVLKDGKSENELYNSFGDYADIPFDVASMEIKHIRAAALPLYAVVIIDV